MITQEMPKDIRSFEFALAGGLTARQIGYGSLTLLIDSIAYFIFLRPLQLEFTLAMKILTFVSMFILVWGLLKVGDVYFSTYVKKIVLPYLTLPTERKPSNKLTTKKTIKISNKKVLTEIYKFNPELRPIK